MLVIVEHWDVALFDQCALDLEALRRLDVFQVDAAEGDGDALDGIDEGLRALGVDFDVEHIDTGEALEQHALAFHDRLGGQRAEVAQAENRGAVGNHRHQVALAGVLEGQLGITGDLADRLGHARAVRQRQVAGGNGRLGQLDAEFSGAGLGVIFESSGLEIRHFGTSAYNLLEKTGDRAYAESARLPRSSMRHCQYHYRTIFRLSPAFG
ncbi:hypothetical protein D3C78_784950 [compost metagenome]